MLHRHHLRYLTAFVAVLTLAFAACGDSGSGPSASSTGTIDAGGGGIGPGGPGGSGSEVPPGLTGGVLATFKVGAEHFRMWTTVDAVGDLLLAAYVGGAPAITSMCAFLKEGPGASEHNAPWSWSIDVATFGPQSYYGGQCASCAFAWNTPGAIEAGIAAGPPYTCDVMWGRPSPHAAMPVVLSRVQDLR